MRILITGSSGQLGAEVARQLSSQHDFIGIDLRPGPWTHHCINVVDREAVRAVMKGIDDVFNISAQSPFEQGDLPALLRDAPSVLQSKAPEVLSFFMQQGWAVPQSIDRVYVIEQARRELGYQPRYNYQEYLRSL